MPDNKKRNANSVLIISEGAFLFSANPVFTRYSREMLLVQKPDISRENTDTLKTRGMCDTYLPNRTKC